MLNYFFCSTPNLGAFQQLPRLLHAHQTPSGTNLFSRCGLYVAVQAKVRRELAVRRAPPPNDPFGYEIIIVDFKYKKRLTFFVSRLLFYLPMRALLIADTSAFTEDTMISEFLPQPQNILPSQLIPTYDTASEVDFLSSACSV